MEKIMETFGKRLKELRTQKHKTQVEMAELLGYGKRKDFEPLYAELKKIKEKTGGGGCGKGWLDEVKAKLSRLF